MKELYEKLYEDCLLMENFSTSSHFVSIRGEYYEQNSKRFMLIGRAVNGWDPIKAQDKASFGKEAEKQFQDYKRWNWIENVNGTLYSKAAEEIPISQRYCLDQKPYWNYTEQVWRQIAGSFEEDTVWQKNIAWSNLYKVSPREGNNPDWNIRQAQQEACIQILKKELEFYQPTHILLVTGYDWFEPFSCLFENVVDTGKRNVLQGKNKNEVYVEAIATYKNAKVVVACRPEWRNRHAYTAEIVKVFNESV